MQTNAVGFGVMHKTKPLRGAAFAEKPAAPSANLITITRLDVRPMTPKISALICPLGLAGPRWASLFGPEIAERGAPRAPLSAGSRASRSKVGPKLTCRRRQFGHVVHH